MPRPHFRKGQFAHLFWWKSGRIPNNFGNHWIPRSDLVEIGHTGFQNNWIPRSVCMEIGHTVTGFKFQKNHNFEIILDGNGAHRFQKKVFWKIYIDGNETCLLRNGQFPRLLRWKSDTPVSRKIEFPILLRWRWGLSGFRKKWMGKSVLMGRGHSRFQGKGNFKISFGGNLACPMAEKVIWHVSMEIEKLNFHVCCCGNGACPDFRNHRSFDDLLNGNLDFLYENVNFKVSLWKSES